jgi:hypothetical protein
MVERFMSEIIKALVQVMGDVGVIRKTQRNQAQNFNFRGIDDVYNAVQPVLVKHGVVVVPTVKVSSREEKPTRSGGVLTTTLVEGTYRFIHTSGSEVSAVTIGEGMDSGDKSTSKAMSAAFKYALFEVLCIPTEEQADADKDAPEPANFTQEELLAIHNTLEAVDSVESQEGLRVLWKQAKAGGYLGMVEGAIAKKRASKGW